MLFTLIVLTTWIYCFSLILVVGAEVIAAASFREGAGVRDRSVAVRREAL